VELLRVGECWVCLASTYRLDDDPGRFGGYRRRFLSQNWRCGRSWGWRFYMGMDVWTWRHPLKSVEVIVGGGDQKSGCGVSASGVGD
jgi:hypothetical protein